MRPRQILNLTYGNRPELFGAGSPTYSGGTTGSIGTGGGAGGSGGGFKYDIPSEALSDEKFAIRILGSPAYICILQRKDRQSIAITPCAAEHPMSFKVPDRLLTDGQCRMRINGVQFVQALLEANGLATGKDYQFKGRYEAEKNAVIISLEKDEREC